MTDDIKRNFLGIPIDGTVQAGSTRVEQLPREDFETIVAKILADEFFVDFGWTQYTPYFNDGDPCEFGTTGLWIRTVKDIPVPTGPFTFQEEADDDDGPGDPSDFEIDYHTHPTLGGQKWPNGYRDSNNKPIEGVYVGDHEAEWRLARELNAAIEGGHFENVLLDLFGDHCQVKVTRTGITIDEYSHD
jgi:hypothetical protein